MSAGNIHSNLRSQLIDKILGDRSTEELIEKFNIDVHHLVEKASREKLESYNDSELVEEL